MIKSIVENFMMSKVQDPGSRLMLVPILFSPQTLCLTCERAELEQICVTQLFSGP